MTTRRFFLRNSALAMVGAGAAPLWLERALYAADAPSPRKKILVAIFQRGAADGLNIVVPHGEKRYYDMRPSIAVPRPTEAAGGREDASIDLDGFFGLHPSLAPLKPIWDDGHLAIVHAAGSPDPTRSHFDAQDFMEAGTPGVKATTDGWMNRAMPRAESADRISPVRAVAMGAVLPRALRGANPAVAVDNLRDFQVHNAQAAGAFQALYADSQDPMLHAAGRETFEAVALLESIQKQRYEPAAGANYPKGRFGDCLRQIAQLIKADVGVEMAFADVGGWDHHVNEVGARASQGQLAARLTEFGQTLAAFWTDLAGRRGDVAVVTMSEFGRTARENGDRGTDHGHANCMFVMGGGVRGGQVYGKWPGLEQEQLYEARDLALTTDFRDILGELVCGQLGNRDLTKVFPGYTPQPRGILA
ncbi:MAG TPA: DUF1501 domain-containing protein [Bryobacteraceae bacterium]|jgi:uncharacterized protein (DUF1501 family)|nr:DUF1501 domain-containing protein [Bryobacteraceae bacterium]